MEIERKIAIRLIFIDDLNRRMSDTWMQVLPFRADSCLLVYLSENAYALKMMAALCSTKLRINIRVFSALPLMPKLLWNRHWRYFCIEEAPSLDVHLYPRHHTCFQKSPPPRFQPFLTFDPFPIRFVRSNEPKPQKFRWKPPPPQRHERHVFEVRLN